MTKYKITNREAAEHYLMYKIEDKNTDLTLVKRCYKFLKAVNDEDVNFWEIYKKEGTLRNMKYKGIGHDSKNTLKHAFSELEKKINEDA